MKWTLSAILMLIPVSLLPCTLHATSLELTAPSSAAKAAYDTLTKHFPPNPQPGNKRFVTNYVLADGNVCHLTYRFYYPSTENLASGMTSTLPMSNLTRSKACRP
ncbi:hypothetical protein ACVWXN_004233 [Bradyrhizobium sp. i1.4.4]